MHGKAFDAGQQFGVGLVAIGNAISGRLAHDDRTRHGDPGREFPDQQASTFAAHLFVV